LASLGLRYDSKEAVEMASSIYKFMANESYKASSELAKEKGVFPVFSYDLHIKSSFIQRLDLDTLESIKINGLRNIGLLTQAPAGSMSILFRNCSSGIEPIYEPYYIRNVKKANSNDMEQHKINHQAIQDCIDAGGDTSVFVSANNINHKSRILMQASAQKYIDHSISSTLNLPESTTIEEVGNIYMEAYDAGLKGITVYRDKCRTGILVSAIDKKKGKLKSPIERPKTTDVTVHKTRYKDKNYMILVGSVDGVPCEVFGGEEPEGLSLPTKYHKAILTKKSRGQYSLQIQLTDNDEDILKISDISARFPAGDIITITRMISLSLRNKVPVSDIVEQLSKSSSALYDPPAIFARVLKLYIPDEEAIDREKSKNKKCPECGEPLEYKRESGCLTEYCPSCSFSNSKCG
jgi:ribonucleoside-diphosphate reductase alpha chain